MNTGAGDSGSVAPRERLAVPVLLGFFAGGLSTLLLVVVNPQSSFVPHFLIYGTAAFLFSIFAARYSRSWLPVVWGALYFGAVCGIVVEALLHEGLGYGSRNLWPFEVVLFAIVAALPSCLGLWLGRRSLRGGA